MRSAFLILVTFLIAAIPANANSEISCKSVQTPDLQNTKINDINFRQGKAYTSDGLNPKDWEHALSTDRIFKPNAIKELRLIIINSNHLTGSGTWDTVIVFDCVRGKLNKIFEKKYLYGVNITTKTDNEILLTSRDWQSNDPMCCPSMEKKEIFRWDDNKGTYDLINTKTEKRK